MQEPHTHARFILPTTFFRHAGWPFAETVFLLHGRCPLEYPEVELLAIGAGPSNLALAVAIEEMAPADFARSCLVIEQHSDVAWQRGMLLPWAQSQVSFLKDLVTMRNPRSRYSF